MSRLFYTDTGEGIDTFVFLHFFGGSHQTWQLVVEKLESKARCICFDLPGFGQSPALPQDAGVWETTAALLNELNEMNLSNATLVGHSMGGKIAVAIACKQPAWLRQLLLIAPSPPFPEPIPDEKRKQLLKAFSNRQGMEGLVKSLTVNPLSSTVFEQVVADHLHIAKAAWDGWLEVGSKEDISAEASTISQPVTILNGDEDPNFSHQYLKETFAFLRQQMNFVTIADCGHLPPLEQPQKVAEILATHLHKQ